MHAPITRSPDLRQTELEDAVVDLLVCANARAFAGSHGSSFSDAICHMRTAHATAHADDRHVLMAEKLSGCPDAHVPPRSPHKRNQ